MDDRVLTTGDPAAIAKMISDTLAAPEVSLVTCRQFISEFVRLHRLIPSRVVTRDSIQLALNLLAPRSISFEAESTALLLVLADLWEADEEWAQAARVLMAIPLDSGHRIISPVQKFKVYIHIVRLLLEGEGDECDHVGAEAYLNRCASLLPSIPSSSSSTAAAATDMDECEGLLLQFKACQGRVLDMSRRFHEAALKYIELAAIVPDPQERVHSLTQAVICAVISKSGPQRTRLLAQLYKDDRVSQYCGPVVSTMLERVYMERLLSPDNTSAFGEMLAPHQLAVLADGSTVWDRSILEHNVVAASKLYRNISLEHLGYLLHLSKEQAEKLVARMINEQRLGGVIDQAEGYLYFKKPDTLHRSSPSDMHLQNITKQCADIAASIIENSH